MKINLRLSLSIQTHTQNLEIRTELVKNDKRIKF